MKNYLLSLAAVAVIAAVSALLSPEEGRGSGFRLVNGLCVLVVVAVPVTSAVRMMTDPDASFLSSIFGDSGISSGDTGKYEEILEENLLSQGGAYLASCVAERLADRYRCEASCFTVRLTFSEDGRKVTAATVLLSGNGIFINTYDMEAYVKQLLGCPCTSAIA